MMSRVIAVIGVMCTTVGAPAPVKAEMSPEAAEAVLRVNVAGRQRMLSQRIVKAACLMSREIMPTAAFDQLTQAYDLFVQSDKALRFGDEAIGLSPEEFESVLTALSKIDAPWSVYKVVVETGIDRAEIAPDQLTALDTIGLDLLKNMNSAVYTTAQAHAAAAPKVPLGLTLTVDVAGRQRMLTQRAVKEACLMASGQATKEMSEKLQSTIGLFDASLLALRDGYPSAGIVPPPSPEVARKLADVAELWRPIKITLENIANGAPLSDRDLAALASNTEPLLRTMNEAVGLYGI